MSDINKPKIVQEVKAIQCPNCKKLFIPAPRCPECGQLVVSLVDNKKHLKERVELLRAMETVCRNINDERVFLHWLMEGVADGDIDSTTTDEELIENYCEDKEGFAEIMDCFLECMNAAYESGGLFCGNVVSNIGEEKE